MRTLVFGLAAAVLPLAAGADEVYLKSGGQLSGRIVSRTATAIEVDIGAGKITVPASYVVRIEEGRSALQEYEERAARVAAGDAEAWLALGDWADGKGLGSQAREAYNRALSAQPGNARANTALGNVRVNNQWVSQEEGYRAQGFVPFEGDWITPAEHAAILRERAVEADQERARAQAELSAREAEARTQEAEARARQAEAEAQARAEQSGGIPLWYAWGAGPVSWNTGSIAVRPVQPINSIGIRR
jgi:hypothetical protein